MVNGDHGLEVVLAMPNTTQNVKCLAHLCVKAYQKNMNSLKAHTISLITILKIMIIDMPTSSVYTL